MTMEHRDVERQAYKPVEREEEDEEGLLHREELEEEKLEDVDVYDGPMPKSRKWNHRYLAIIVVAFLTGILIPVLLGLIFPRQIPPQLTRPPQPPPTTPAASANITSDNHEASADIFGDCGTKNYQAEAKGCKFDAVSWTFQPPECFDETLHNELLKKGDWDWHTRAGNGVGLKALSGDWLHLWAKREFHIWRCVYLQKKYAKGAENGLTDSYTASWKWTEQCDKILTEELPREQWWPIALTFAFEKCKKI